MKKRNGSTLIYLLAFFIIFLAFCAFAVDGTIVFAQRARFQNAIEAAALAGASAFSQSNNQADIQAAAIANFNMWKYGSLKYANLTVPQITVDTGTREVSINANTLAEPFFLSFLGISAIELNAKARAVCEDLPVMSSYGGAVKWVTPSATYYADIISKDLNLNDTAILTPLGNARLATLSSLTGSPMWGLIEPNGNSLSLGPSGFITIKLPAPIIDRTGDDLEIIENGDLREGYMVFIGLDVNPDKPYSNYEKPGDGIRWSNISCTGNSSDGLGNNAHASATGTNLPTATQDKFYGSGRFDIGESCSNFGGVSMAKYLRIIDDNEESGYANGVKYFPYGEASTPTAGADIDSVTVLNHVRLLKPNF